MPEYLQITIDKFVFRVANERFYTSEGTWLQPVAAQTSPRVRVGVTDFFQQHNGDIAFANVKTAGSALNPGDEIAEIETMKVNISVASPVKGTVAEVNRALEMTPEIINEDPYGAGWLAEIDVPEWELDRAKLLDAAAYLAVMQAQAQEELKS